MVAIPTEEAPVAAEESGQEGISWESLPEFDGIDVDGTESDAAALPELGLPPSGPAPKITLEQAMERIGSPVLKALGEYFNGSLVAVRSPDEKDHLF